MMMCEWGDTVSVSVRRPKERPGNALIDRCIAPLVHALNQGGFITTASCCGHGNRPGNIVLADGSELVICPDFETGRAVDAAFPDIHGEHLTDSEGA